VNGAPPSIDIVVSQMPGLRVGKSAAKAAAASSEWAANAARTRVDE
jgi:hypothetical protein